MTAGPEQALDAHIQSPVRARHELAAMRVVHPDLPASVLHELTGGGRLLVGRVAQALVDVEDSAGNDGYLHGYHEGLTAARDDELESGEH